MLFLSKYPIPPCLTPRCNRGEPFTVICTLSWTAFWPVTLSLRSNCCCPAVFPELASGETRLSPAVPSSLRSCSPEQDSSPSVSSSQSFFFSYRYCESTDLFKIEPGCRNMPSDKKNSSTKFAPRTAISSPSVTSLLLNIAKHCTTNRLISLQQECSILVSASCFLTNARCSRVGITSFSLRQSSKESWSLQWNKQTQRVCSRKFFRTELYFCARTQTDCSAWLPEKASIDSISFFFVNAVKAEQSSMIYNVGSHINAWSNARK